MAHPFPRGGERLRGHVAFFLAYPHVYGGVEQTVHVLARGLPARGWSVEVIVPGSGRLIERLRDDGISARVVPAPAALSRFGGTTTGWRSAMAAAALPGYWVQVARSLRRRASLLHTFTQRGILLSGPAARLAGVPAVWWIGGFEPSAALNRAGSLVATRTIAVTKAVLATTPGLRHRDRITVVPNGFDPRLEAVVPSPPASPPIVACASRLTPEKGIDVLIRAIAHLRSRMPDVHLLVVGGAQAGHEAHWRHLQALRRDLDLESRVQFAAFTDRPELAWKGASVYVQPSLHEGFGLAVVEAMACGLPVVASRVGGLAEIVEDGRTGILVPPGDERALASALERVLVDRALAGRMAAAGQEHARARYSAQRMTDAIADVYAEISGSP